MKFEIYIIAELITTVSDIRQATAILNGLYEIGYTENQAFMVAI